MARPNHEERILVGPSNGVPRIGMSAHDKHPEGQVYVLTQFGYVMV